MLGTFTQTANADGDSEGSRQLRPKACGAHGAQVVDVRLRILNDDDSGFAGNAWATDTINRTIQVWQVGTGTYCAIIRDEGTFVTRAGVSPYKTGTTAAGIKGELEGGYRTSVFAGTLLAGAKTHGNLGTVDYRCVGDFVCPGWVYWPSRFFSNVVVFDQVWWGWSYDADDHGSWVNAIDVPPGSGGDIR